MGTGRCGKCGREVPQGFVIGHETVCPACGAELHRCSFCEYYEPSSHYGCRENVDEPVRDKERANFCDSFRLSCAVMSSAGASQAEEKKQKARDAFAALFKN